MQFVIFMVLIYEIVDDSESNRNNPRHKPTKPSHVHISIDKNENVILKSAKTQKLNRNKSPVVQISLAKGEF